MRNRPRSFQRIRENQDRTVKRELEGKPVKSITCTENPHSFTVSQPRNAGSRKNQKKHCETVNRKRDQKNQPLAPEIFTVSQFP
jgi:hypothetical protein